MCNTCNYTKYIEAEKQMKDKTIKYLKADPTHCCLDISCDIDGMNYKIGDFTIYRCPTCGSHLWKTPKER
jgi:hypothetical protein